MVKKKKGCKTCGFVFCRCHGWEYKPRHCKWTFCSDWEKSYVSQINAQKILISIHGQAWHSDGLLLVLKTCADDEVSRTLFQLGTRICHSRTPGPQNRRTRRTCAEDQRKLGGPKIWLTKFSSLDSWGTNNHAIGGWRTKDILGGPKSLETKKLGSSKGWEDQSAEKTNNWKDKKIFNKRMGHRIIKYFIYALLLLFEFVEIYALFGRTKQTKNLRWEDQNRRTGPRNAPPHYKKLVREVGVKLFLWGWRMSAGIFRGCPIKIIILYRLPGNCFITHLSSA